jgi:hypothetical protein
MKLRNAEAPIQNQLINEIGLLFTSREEEAPRDSYDRVDYRLEVVTAPYDDDDAEDRTQPVRDLLTDIVHLCDAKGWDIHTLVERAEWMAQQERQDWGPR